MAGHLMMLLLRSALGNTSAPPSTLGQTWSLASSVPARDYYGVAYGDGLYVAVGTDGSGNPAIATSPDAVTWTARTVPETAPLRLQGVVYANGLWVVGGGEASENTTNGILTSTDGVTWTQRTDVSSYGWWDIAYAEGLYVAVTGSLGSANSIATSPDGITWTARTNPSTTGRYYGNIVYGNGVFVAVSGGLGAEQAITSPDGITWTTRTVSNEAIILNDVMFGDGLFVAVGKSFDSSSRIWTSPDGITWTARSETVGDSNNGWQGSAYGDGVYALIGYLDIGGSVASMQLATSTNGIDWTARTSPESFVVQDMTYGGGRFVSVGFTSPGLPRDPAIIYAA